MQKHEYWQSIHGQKQAKSFHNRFSAKTAAEVLSLSRNQQRIMIGLLTGHCHLKGPLYNEELVKSPTYDRCKKPSEMASHVLCDCAALATVRFRHLGWHFIKPDD
jgi:hypothetical protein